MTNGLIRPGASESLELAGVDAGSIVTWLADNSMLNNINFIAND